MHGADVASATMQAAVDVHQAAVVAGGDDLGVGAEDGIELFIEHRAGDVGVLDGEGSAEAAALLRGPGAGTRSILLTERRSDAGPSPS